METPKCVVCTDKVNIFIDINTIGDASMHISPKSEKISSFTVWVNKVGSIDAAFNKAKNISEKLDSLITELET